MYIYIILQVCYFIINLSIIRFPVLKLVFVQITTDIRALQVLGHCFGA